MQLFKKFIPAFLPLPSAPEFLQLCPGSPPLPMLWWLSHFSHLTSCVSMQSSFRVLCWGGPAAPFPSILPVCHLVPTLCPSIAPLSHQQMQANSLQSSAGTSARLLWELQQQKAACHESPEMAGLHRSLLRRGSSSGETPGAVISASPAANHGLISLLCPLTPLLQRLMHVSPWTPSSLEGGSSEGTFGRFIALPVGKVIMGLGI